MADDAKLTHGPVVSGMLRFGFPLAIAMAFHGLFNCVDLLIVGRLGPGAVAAVTVGGVINMVTMLAYNGLGNVFAGRAATLAGANDTQELASLDRAIRRLTWGLSIILGFAFALLADPLVDSFDLDGQTAADAREYLIILSAGSGTMFFLLYQSAGLRALGESKGPMYILIGANVLNLLLDIVLIFGLYGFPELGVVGAAWATVASRLLGACVLGRMYRNRQEDWPHAAPNVAAGLSALWKGLAHSAQMVVRVVSLFALLVIASETVSHVTSGSRDLLDGVGVSIRLEMVILFSCLGWGTGAASFLGQNCGAHEFGRAARGMASAVGGALITCLMLTAVLFFFSESCIKFVAPEVESAAIDAANSYLKTVLLGHPGLIIAVVLSQALVGIGSVWTAVIIDAVLYLLILLPVAVERSGSSRSEDVWKVLLIIHLISAPLYLLAFRKRFLREKEKVNRNRDL